MHSVVMLFFELIFGRLQVSSRVPVSCDNLSRNAPGDSKGLIELLLQFRKQRHDTFVFTLVILGLR